MRISYIIQPQLCSSVSGIKFISDKKVGLMLKGQLEISLYARCTGAASLLYNYF